MPRLSDYTTYADAHRHHNKQALWDLFDGDRERLNIGQECLDRHPRQRTAVRIAKSDGGSDAYSFAELSDCSNRIANFLLAQGLTKGDRVAIMLEPSLAFYAILFGTMKAGAVAVPLFTLFGPDGLALRLDDCAPAMLFLAPDRGELAAVAHAPCKVQFVDAAFFEALDRLSADFTIATSADDMAMYQYTSGTTRQVPEAVKHRHRSIVTVMLAALYGTGVRPGDRFMCPSSPAWGHGLWHGTIAPLALGITIASYAGKFDPARLLAALEEFEINNLSAAATHYRMLKNSGCIDQHRYRIEKLTFTGEHLDSDTAQWAEASFGRPVGSIYGSTEVGVILVDYPAAGDYQIRRGSLGKPVPGIELDIRDGHGKSLGDDEIGEICLQRREAWVGTKDLGRRDKDGYYYHHGRADDVIISAGWTMSAVEIEDVMLKHEDVDEIGVIGVPDELRGQIVKAFVVSRRAASAAFVAELQDFTKAQLAQHEYPRAIAFVDGLPKTPAGKVNRKVLRDMDIAPS